MKNREGLVLAREKEEMKETKRERVGLHDGDINPSSPNSFKNYQGLRHRIAN